VELEINPEAFKVFGAGKDRHADMARVLNEYAKTHAKKAS
jgi:hypothetical protein